MKKTLLAVILAVACVACLAACGEKKPEPAPAPETQSQAPVAEVPVMTHEEYVAAPLDSLVCVETYIQAKQSWWDNKATLYTQAEDGAYFIYNMPCSEEDYNNVLTIGTKIKVTGFKSEWSGEVEIIDATYKVIEGEHYIADPIDVTDLLGTDELIAHQNEFVSFKGLKIAASKDAKGNDAAYLYNWDGSGSKGDDLYFNVEDAKGNVYQFTVESYLCGADTEVYQTVETLQIGQTVDLEGFLYWYEGVNPHITKVVVK